MFNLFFKPSPACLEQYHYRWCRLKGPAAADSTAAKHFKDANKEWGSTTHKTSVQPDNYRRSAMRTPLALGVFQGRMTAIDDV